MAIAATIAEIKPVAADIAAAVQDLLDNKTKPRRSLGQLETLACRLAAAWQRVDPEPPAKAIVVMAADHGVAADGVSAYPAEVTAQMVANFAAGGAAINVLAAHAGAELHVVDMGVKVPIAGLDGVADCRVAAGTANLAKGPAMSRAQAQAAIETGIDVARGLAQAGIGIVGLGEMGIGNTTAAAALAAVLLDLPVADLVGRGTGIDDDGLERKIAAIEAGIDVSAPDRHDALDVLAKVGGFEIAGLVGVCLGAAAAGLPVVVDGFITAAAALVATRLCPEVGAYLVAAHLSVEQGHRHILDDLGLEPLLDMDLRLGEGTGAALAFPLVDASLKILRDMATFASAGVSDSGQ